MVKQFHPHRFARQPADIQTLANEIFLLVKKAYDELQSETPRRKRSTTRPPAPGRRKPVRFKRSTRGPKPLSQTAPKDPGPPPAARTPARKVENHDQLVSELENEHSERERQFAEAKAMVQRGRPAEAREVFRQLAVKNPGERRFRVHMHYAWGREHEGAGDLDSAAAEFRRSLQLEPTFQEAAEALESVTERLERETSGGVFGRLFRRGR